MDIKYDYSHSVTTMLQRLNWLTLQHRHKSMCLTLPYCTNLLMDT